MNIYQIFAAGGGALAVLLTILQIAPIKINPWSAIAHAIGRAINAPMMDELRGIKETLDKHITKSEHSDADARRTRILHEQFVKYQKKYEEEQAAKATSKWAEDAVAYCKANGIMLGDTDDKFRPQSPVTRQEVAQVAMALDKRSVDK